ncbi:MAG: hypothetical protein GX763_04010 [Clostridiaceae bacterium]|nr:hypothetical protein [Clostridiaceae bacterium]
MESSPAGNGNGTGPPGNGEIVEPSFYVGLPGDREERFSLAYARAEDLTLNPFLNEQKNNVFEPYDLIYEKLLRYDKVEGRYESGILESISFSDRQVVLHIKGDLSFHNGFNLMANDILQTFNLYRTSGHRLGQILDEAVDSYTTDDNFTVSINLSDDENAVLALFDCMEEIPILPFQLWDAILPAVIDLAGLQEISPLPTVGSGPYRILRQDDFALILEKYTQQPDSSYYDAYPQYLVYYKYQKEELALAALAHNDLDVFLNLSDSHPQEVMADTLKSFAAMSFWEPDSADSFFPLSVQEKRMGIALNPVSDRLEKLAARKFVQSIMLSLNNAQRSLYPGVPDLASLPAWNQLTLPSILSQDLTKTDSRLLPGTSSQVINSYLDELGWTRDPRSALIVDENSKLVELDFYYPAISDELSDVCRQMAEFVKDYGLAITAVELSVEDWQARLQNHNYDLIYMESQADESIPRLLARIQLWSGLESGSELGDSRDFAAESGRELIQLCESEALAFNSITVHLQSLNTFLIENSLFIPLGIALKSGGIGSDLYFSADLNVQLQSH